MQIFDTVSQKSAKKGTKIVNLLFTHNQTAFILPLITAILATLLSSVIISKTTSRIQSVAEHDLLMETLENIYIGCAKEWVDSRLGVPIFSYTADSSTDDYQELYNLNYKVLVGVYVTDPAIVSVYYDYESLSCKAFMITSRDDSRKNTVNLPEQYEDCVNGKSLNRFSYYEISGSPNNVYSYGTNGTSRSFYMESYYFASWGNYYDFYFGSVDYGYPKSIKELSSLFGGNTSDGEIDYSQAEKEGIISGAQLTFDDRTKVSPNTYAISSLDYNSTMYLLSDYLSFDSFQLRGSDWYDDLH